MGSKAKKSLDFTRSVLDPFGVTGGRSILDRGGRGGGFSNEQAFARNPFFNEIFQGGFDPNLIPEGTFGRRTELGGGLQKLSQEYLLNYANAAGQNRFLQEFGPKQLETAFGLAQKDYELISQLPQYKPFLDLQNQTLGASGELLGQIPGQLADVEQAKGLLNVGQYAGGNIPSEFSNRFKQNIAEVSGLFGVQDQPAFAAQAGAAYSGQKELLSNQLLTQGLGTINQLQSGAFGRIGSILGGAQSSLAGFRMPGSLLGAVNYPQGGGQFSQLYKQQRDSEKARRDAIQSGYIDAGLGLAGGLLGAFGQGGAFGRDLPSPLYA